MDVELSSPKKQKSSISSAMLVVAIVLGFSFLLIGGISLEPPPSGNEEKKTGVMISITPQVERKNLQLAQLPFKIVTIAPTSKPSTPQPTKTPTRQCQMGENVEGCQCQEGAPGPFTGNPMIKVVYCPYDPPPPRLFGNPMPGAPLPGTVWHIPQRANDLKCHIACFDKPVIYLYPKEKTTVDVTLKVPGVITKSIPEYKDGWRKIQAYPDGTLEYQGSIYKELFYETSVHIKINKPTKGLLIQSKDLPERLSDVLARLGLNEYEINEFLDYWVPRLQDLNAPAIFFSVYSQQEKEKFDKIIITPEPDTRIELLAYFKPIYTSYFVEPLVLPEKPPKRLGFTEVEWGGTLDLN